MAETQTKFMTPKLIAMLLVVLVLFPLLPMLIAGVWDWWQAWAYAIVSDLTFIFGRLLAGRRHPDLILERARFMEAKDTKSWDKLLAPLVAFGSIVIMVVAGWEKRSGLTDSHTLTSQLIALFLIVIGYGFSSWALIENRFFSGTVRIQTERGHQVVTTGPYRIVRHPGYAGALLGYVSLWVLLDSVWALIPTCLLGLVLVVRTMLEDRTLQAELPGYREYAQKTRYRLIPWIW